MRLIDADEILCKMEIVMDMQDVYLPVHFMEMVIDEMPTIEVEPTCAQIKWERDQAIKQLESYGVGFCENAEVRKVVYARWEINCDGYYPYCSNCKSEPQGRAMTRYCPNCGAKMDLEEDENGT